MDVEMTTEQHYAVQWRLYSNWVTHTRQHATEKDALRELQKRRDSDDPKTSDLHWRAVEITRTVRRLDGGNDR